KVSWGATELNAPLQALGMHKAFAPAADFSGIASGPLFIGSVRHKAYVEVNEDGTEAAAATAVMMKRGLSTPKTFKANHPFLFLIRDNTTGSLLFLGRLVDPGNEQL
ncbi:MAG TPA: serpin family protein, partial [Gammaproteobacteria bacterium]